ncbi:aldehyde dehydrogenase (NADP(+)) [Rhizobium laguerreae]|uniref:NADP-dependent aldehyde dehydrogenase n=1 Tax=Rhizobium laguerreae TaxID=1076926 RepID=A0ABR6GB54_9HYPH|nr:aldehyde dehydrogenase (NADP(+)) [Rhizobium laguerreae]MBB3163481.1 NADP-dependent aldehyde dehydrogenase [Rhizobium laguerreae]MBY3168267.1 aldehyde dehydrogenase (NADP(+)) [Rhizobium laguerreae]MBY3464997.1 aldehyde dehydrogenase (NADP(+)) [Rhizobium laguerreae]OOO41771.1 aldehyde dehydrogenase (NADP(+)) [Rhizobium laguerreae]
MTLSGDLLIGGANVRGAAAAFSAINPANGNPMEPRFAGATKEQVEEATSLAWDAFPIYKETSLDDRARFLEAIAEGIVALGDDLVLRAIDETGLPRGRIEGERARTVGQLRLFAKEVRDGRFQELRFDPADTERRPVAKQDLRLRNVALGPVAVFGASNFPLAFSVAGGDTASALAAGCPVIVKAHSAHPGTSELVGRAVADAVAACGLPRGTFGLLFDAGFEVGQTLVADHRIRAVGFTGSRRGGTALMKIASERKQPIPVYAEMSSINPVILYPNALRSRGAEIGKSFVSSLTLGAGQFCTNPGLIIAVEGAGLDAFIESAAAALSESQAQTMLTGGIFDAYCNGVARLSSSSSVSQVAAGKDGTPHQAAAALFETTAAAFLANPELQEEVFGASGLIVRCRDDEELRRVVGSLEGQLTIALHVDAGDIGAASPMISQLELLAGRLLVNGFGTGVEVSPAMVHGGPYPATSDGRSTSVGTMAIYRFLRPVSYQDFPIDLLPEPLKLF